MSYEFSHDRCILDELEELQAKADLEDAAAAAAGDGLEWSDVTDEADEIAEEDQVIALPALPVAAAAAGPSMEEQAEAWEEALIEDEDLLRDFELGGLPRYSHDGLAFFLGRSGWDLDAKYVSGWNEWLFFDGSRWKRDDNLRSFSEIRAFLRGEARRIIAEAGDGKAGAAARKTAEVILQAATVAAVEKTARSNSHSRAKIEDFDVDPMLLGTPAGTVDLRTGETTAASREDLISKSTAVAPAAPGEVPERFLAFLETIFEGDQEIIGFIQRALGYALTGSTEEHKVLFFYGGGRNGKGVLLNTVYKLLGDYSRRSPVETFLKKISGHPTDVAGLAGARMVIGGEIPNGTTWNEAMIKDLTGGDELTARFMRGDYFDFVPQLTLFLQGNTQPSFKSVNKAIRARFVLVPFNVTFEEEDRDNRLMQRMIEEEGPQILRWLIDGAVEWNRRAAGGKSGLDVPAKLLSETKEYFDREDDLAQFIGEEAVAEKGAFAASNELYTRYRAWAEARGLRDIGTQRDLVKELKKRGFADDRRSGARGLAGLRLLAPGEKAAGAAAGADAEVVANCPY